MSLLRPLTGLLFEAWDARLDAMAFRFGFRDTLPFLGARNSLRFCEATEALGAPSSAKAASRASSCSRAQTASRPASTSSSSRCRTRLPNYTRISNEGDRRGSATLRVLRAQVSLSAEAAPRSAEVFLRWASWKAAEFHGLCETEELNAQCHALARVSRLVKSFSGWGLRWISAVLVLHDCGGDATST